MKRDLAEWLDYQLRAHPQSIAMGLDRVREVARLNENASFPLPVHGERVRVRGKALCMLRDGRARRVRPDTP